MSEPNERQDIDAGGEPAPDEHEQMRPIWYFVGMILAVVGTLVVIAGIVNLINPPQQQTVLAHLHVNLWWGLIITLAGIGMWLMSRRAES